MQLDRMELEIELFSFWRTATGAGQAARHDALCALDRDGLPYIPARQIKGLLRDAVRRLDLWQPEGWPELKGLPKLEGGSKPTCETILFGEQGLKKERETDEEPVAFRRAQPGALTFTSARLSAAERAQFVEDDVARAALFATLHSTAMEHGIAKHGSLRREQVAIPMTLECDIGFEPETDAHRALAEDWKMVIETALPLVRALGGKRRRGLGRACLRIMGGRDAA